MHPRDGKDKWFSSSPVIPGIRGRQLPEGMLVCNFSVERQGPGLMQYSEVVTFFHEFGHLMHHILAVRPVVRRRRLQCGGRLYRVASQMLEEMFHDTAILQSFGKHYQTGETIPASLIAKMNAASAYGRGRWLQGQLWASYYSLQTHNQPGQSRLRRSLEGRRPAVHSLHAS